MIINNYISNNLLLEDKLGDDLEKWLKSGDFLSFFQLVQSAEQNKDDTILSSLYRFCLDTLYNNRDIIKVTSPFYFEKLRLNWLTEILEKKNEDFVKAVRWLRVCVNVDNEYIRFYFEVSKRDREEEVKKIIFNNNGRLKPFYMGKADLYTEYLLDWFLRRYNLAIATKLVFILCRQKITQSKGFMETLKSNFPKSVGNWLFPLLVLIGLVALASNYLGSIFDSLFQAYSISAHVSLSNVNCFTTVLFWLYPLMLILLVLSFWRKMFLWFKLMIPRMVGGIVVGYLPLLLTDEAWNMVKEIDVLEASCLITFAFGVSLYYIFIEIHNTLKDKWESLVRALRVFATGLLESLVIGIIVLDLITKAFKPSLLEEGLLVHGLLGYIYPKLLYIYFPLALLIGIFVQIIWEDKPITHPL